MTLDRLTADVPRRVGNDTRSTRSCGTNAHERAVNRHVAAVVEAIMAIPSSATKNGSRRRGSLDATAQNVAPHSGIASSRRSTIGMCQPRVCGRSRTTFARTIFTLEGAAACSGDASS
jgi:hypothetical protein